MMQASLDAANHAPTDPGDLSAVFTGVEERLRGCHPLSLTPAPTPEATDAPVIPDGNGTTRQGENGTAVVPDYDDGELLGLIENSSVSLMLLSVQNAHAFYAWDEKSAKENAAALRAFAEGALADAATLNVSNDQKHVQTVFILALESYVAVGETVQENTSLNRTQVDTALQELRRGSGYLREAFTNLEHPALHVPEKTVAINLSVPRLYASPAPEEELALLQRYVYEDRSRANDISLMLESVREIHTYHLQGGEAVTAEPGRMFLLVKVKVTNVGHKGDNRVYLIRTPEISAFTLHYRGTTYSPVELVPGTSLGEPYGPVTLNRYEKKMGYIVFDVPEALIVSDSYVQVNLDRENSPIWTLGKTS